MNNINYLPFERNHYYYGKLLSVEDFELEQRYLNNKRRLINRYLNGNGVVSGLSVVIIDDETLSLERGIAIDDIGREIVVEESITKKISEIEGYDTIDNDSISYAYLCMEYDEEKKEIVHNVAGRNQTSDLVEFNKYRERYRLYLSSIEPKSLSCISNEEIYTEKNIVYSGNGIRIYHIIPRYVHENSEFEFKVEVENIGQINDFAFSYEVDLIFLKYNEIPKLKVDFDEKLVKKSKRYHMTYKLSAVNADGIASAEIDGSSFRFSIERTSVEANINAKSKTTIVNGNLIDHIKNYYYQTQMNHAMDGNEDHKIYLAKVFLIKAGNGSVINEIEPIPFNQYAYSNDLNYTIGRYMLIEMEHMRNRLDIMERKSIKKENKVIQNNILAFGKYELSLGKHKNNKRKLILSDEIPHGLGIGQTGIILGIENNEGEIIYGLSEIFSDSEPSIRLVSKVFTEKGTFVIGVRIITHAYHNSRLLEANKESLTIHWIALKNADSSKEADTEKRIIINPAVIEMTVRESRFINVTCQNMNDQRLIFRVNNEKNNDTNVSQLKSNDTGVSQLKGIVDKNGLYTAPDCEGIYEVTVESMVYSDVKASAFIVVRSV